MSIDTPPPPPPPPPPDGNEKTPMERWEAAEDRLMAENIVANRKEAEILRQQGNFEGAQQIEDSIAKLPVPDDIKEDPQAYLDGIQSQHDRSPGRQDAGTGAADAPPPVGSPHVGAMGNGADGSAPLTPVEKPESAERSLANWETPTDLPPNASIDAGRYQFGTDGLGRLVEATGELELQPGQRQQADAERVREMMVSDFRDQAGHMIGARFGGPGDNWNMVLQDQNLNQSEWKVMENEWAAALRDGKSVHVHIDLNYDGDDLRPYAFNVEYTIRSPEGEEIVQRDVLNAPRAAKDELNPR